VIRVDLDLVEQSRDVAPKVLTLVANCD